MSRCYACDKIMQAPISLTGYCSSCRTMVQQTNQHFVEKDYDREHTTGRQSEAQQSKRENTTS